jgi:hypothetical protein
MRKRMLYNLSCVVYDIFRQRSQCVIVGRIEPFSIMISLRLCFGGSTLDSFAKKYVKISRGRGAAGAGADPLGRGPGFGPEH